MAKVVRLRDHVSARDRALLVEILGAAQLAQAYGTYTRAVFMSKPRDQQMIAERLAQMADAAAKVSPALKKAEPDVPWDKLAAAKEYARGELTADDQLKLWNAVKKIVPRVTAGLAPLIAKDTPEAALMLDPFRTVEIGAKTKTTTKAKTTKTTKPKATKTKRASTRASRPRR